MNYENNEKRIESVYSTKIRAGKRRTYFFDVRATKGNDYFLTITESRKRFDDNGYDRHKVFLYKEDFNKFIKALNEAVDYVKTELMPDYDFDAFNHDNLEEANQNVYMHTEVAAVSTVIVENIEMHEVQGAHEVNEVGSLENLPSASTPANTAIEGDNLQSEEVDKW